MTLISSSALQLKDSACSRCLLPARAGRRQLQSRCRRRRHAKVGAPMGDRERWSFLSRGRELGYASARSLRSIGTSASSVTALKRHQPQPRRDRRLTSVHEHHRARTRLPDSVRQCQTTFARSERPFKPCGADPERRSYIALTSPMTWPSGSAKCAIVGPLGTSIGSLTVLPPSDLIFSSAAAGSSTWM
jgi:hypothetical protein